MKIIKAQEFQTSWQKQKALRVIKIMERVLNSETFKKRVLSYNFVDRRFKYNFSDPDWIHIIDNERIYEILTEGTKAESNPNGAYIWNLKIRIGQLSTEIGHKHKDWIVTQNWFFRRDNNEADVAAHWIHEYAHILGFIHDYYRPDFQEHSVPNALGIITKEILEKSSGKDLT